MLSLGGLGVISVLSNIAPKQTKEITSQFLTGEIQTACKLQLNALPLIKSLFSETNPIPVKHALNIMGYNFGNPRLPLVYLSDNLKKNLEFQMKSYGIL